MSKGFTGVYILILVLILATLAGGYYFIGRSQIKPSTSQPQTSFPTPRSTETEKINSWKTYENINLGISFNLPENWEIQQLDPSWDISMGPKDSLRIISVTPPITDKDISEIKRPYITNDMYDVSPKNIDYQNYTITEYTLSFKGALKGQTSVISLIEYQGKVVKWELLDFSSKQIFDQILQTFKFTN